MKYAAIQIHTDCTDSEKNDATVDITELLIDLLRSRYTDLVIIEHTSDMIIAQFRLP